MIEEITVRFADSFAGRKPRDPVMIEGLPGIGQVGKLVAEYMIHILRPEKVAEITSIYFPPQVVIEENGVARMVRNEVYFYEGESRDLVFLVGDHQGTSAEGHYLLADRYCEIAGTMGVRRIYTLGGFGVGHLVNEPRVLGAVNSPDLRGEIEAAGVLLNRDEPGGGIVGAAGLMLGLARQQGIDAVCLMGETSGYLVDPMAASSVLAVLSGLIGVPVDRTKLNDRAAEMERVIETMAENEKKEEELSYIG